MPIIFRYKGFEFRFWCSSEEERPHVHAIKINEKTSRYGWNRKSLSRLSRDGSTNPC